MHILCPHCHNANELVRLALHEEIVCGSCGSGKQFKKCCGKNH
jgi:hypothetical protein